MEDLGLMHPIPLLMSGDELWESQKGGGDMCDVTTLMARHLPLNTR